MNDWQPTFIREMDPGEVGIFFCPSTAEDLALRPATLPKLVRDIRERHETNVGYADRLPKVKHLHVAEVVPKRRIANEDDLELTLNALMGC